MNVIIFGATGGIGKWVVKHSLEKGYHVTAYVRNKQKMAIHNDKLAVIQGEIYDYDKLKSAMADQDAVIWCVGIPMKNKLVNFAISREDIGAFMVEQVESKDYIRSMPIIGS